MALQAFRRIQVGKETVRGTGVAANKKLIGTMTMTPELTWHRPTDERNSLAEFRRAIVTAQMARLRYEAAATYDQIIDFLSMGVKGGITPTTPGGGSASRLWTFTPNLTASNVQEAYTIEYGDNSQEFESVFCMVESLELSIALNDVMGLSADLFGRYPAKSTFTGALSDPSVTEIVANNAKIYIDGVWANLGNTQKASLLTGATVRLATGLAPVKYADGSLDFSTFVESVRHLEIDLDYAMSAAAITEYDAAVAGTTRAIRIQLTGPIIEGAIPYQFTIDVTGKYSTVPEFFGARDGEDTISLTFVSHEDSLGNEMLISAQNTQIAL